MLQKAKNLTALYVEDESVTQALSAKQLNKYFKRVLLAPDGEQALKLFMQEKPDVLITDLAMPKMSGFDLIDRVREMAPELPIFVITAYRDEIHRVKDKVSGILYKPFRIAILVEMLKTVFSFED